MKTFLKRCYAAYRAYQRLSRFFQIWQSCADDIRCGRLVRTVPPHEDFRLLIVPCDPWTVVGSRGDEAMIRATLRQYRDTHPALAVTILTLSASTDRVVKAFGAKPWPAWSEDNLSGLVRSILAQFDEVVLLGADVMDGHYGIFVPCLLLALTDLCTWGGLSARLLGFSFNRHPDRRLRCAFDRLSPEVLLRARDEVSLARLRAFTSHERIALVADAAFGMMPDPDFADYGVLAAWVDQQRRSGRRVIGFNVHAMYPGMETEQARQDWIDRLAQGLQRFLATQPDIALCLVPHDDRPEIGDWACLGQIATALKGYSDRIRLIDKVYPAPQIKAITGLLAGVVSGRMHLTIAALGQGVPVMGFDYQDKFEGLFRHFGLPPECLVQPAGLTPEGLAGRLATWTRELDDLRNHVSKALPQVLELSHRNFV